MVNPLAAFAMATAGVQGANIIGNAAVEVIAGRCKSPGEVAKVIGKACGELTKLIPFVNNDDDDRVDAVVAQTAAATAVSLNAVAKLVGGIADVPEDEEEWRRMTKLQARQRLLSFASSFKVAAVKFIDGLSDENTADATAYAGGARAAAHVSLIEGMAYETSINSSDSLSPEDNAINYHRRKGDISSLLRAFDRLQKVASIGDCNPDATYDTTDSVIAFVGGKAFGTGVSVAPLGRAASQTADGVVVKEVGTAARTENATKQATFFTLTGQCSDAVSATVILSGEVNMIDVIGDMYNDAALADVALPRYRKVFVGSAKLINSRAKVGELTEATHEGPFQLIFPNASHITRSEVASSTINMRVNSRLYMQGKGATGTASTVWWEAPPAISAYAVVMQFDFKQDSVESALSGGSTRRGKVVGVIPFNYVAHSIEPGYAGVPANNMRWRDQQTVRYTGTWDYDGEFPASKSVCAMIVLDPNSPWLDGSTGLFDSATVAHNAGTMPSFTAPASLLISIATASGNDLSLEYVVENANGEITDDLCHRRQKLLVGKPGNVSAMRRRIPPRGMNVDENTYQDYYEWTELHEPLVDIIGSEIDANRNGDEVFQLTGVARTGEGVFRSSIGTGDLRHYVTSIAPKPAVWEAFATAYGKAFKKNIPKSFEAFCISKHLIEVPAMERYIANGGVWQPRA